MGRYVIHLDRKQACTVRLSGGKGASLAQLHQLGFSTPPGFVITPRAFYTFLDHFSAGEIAQKKHWSRSELQLIQSWFHSNTLPSALRRAIRGAYQRYQSPVAVRSSLVGEDSEAASFAGQLDTFLNVEGEADVLDTIKRCWASLFSLRLIAYLHGREEMTLSNIGHRFAMAVVVQQMVPAQAAGVAFSVNPLTGEPHVVIEAVKGLGDALVAGHVDPDHYVISADNTPVKIAPADITAKVLPPAEISKLAQLTRKVHEAIGSPQDIEWAWDGQAFVLLQSRPVTSLADQRVYSASMVSEMLPGLIKPLVWSISTRSKLQRVLGRIFTELIGPNDMDFSKLAKRIHSRVYADNTMLSEILVSMGLPSNFFEVMSRDEKATHHRRMPVNFRTLRTMLRIGRFVWRYGSVAKETESYLSSHTQALEPYRRSDWSTTDSQTLLEQITKLHNLYSESMWMNFIGPLNMMLRNRLLTHFVKLWVPSMASTDLVRGLHGLKSLQSDYELRSLAQQASNIGDEAIELLATGDDATIHVTLAGSPEGRALLEAMDTFLERFGFLNAIGTDVSRPPWIEQPSAIWRSVGRYARTDHKIAAEDLAHTREAAQQDVMSRLNWWQRRVFGRVLGSTIVYIGLRERTSFLISEDSYQLRRVILALADNLIEQDRLGQRDDIFYLSLEEVRALVAGSLPAAEARFSIDTRRHEMATDAGLDLPTTIYGDEIPTMQVTPVPGQEFLAGISGSSGVVHGQARIVLDPAQAPPLIAPTDILVVPFTDVSWTPLFAGIGGIVAETGGQLSHSAIIARELGLPAVVNVKHATRLIQEGQNVTLDGNQGRIYLQ